MVNLSTKSLQVHHTYVKKRELQIQIIFEVIFNKKNHINNDNNKNHFLEPNIETKKQSTFFFLLLIS